MYYLVNIKTVTLNPRSRWVYIFKNYLHDIYPSNDLHDWNIIMPLHIKLLLPLRIWLAIILKMW